MEINAAKVKELRDSTGAGMMDCKRALEEAGGDLAKAQDLLRTRGLAAAAKRAGRAAGEGVIEAYIHANRRFGALIELNCETDFVANTDEFRGLARDLAMQVTAANPQWVRREDASSEELDRERKIYEEQARELGKPEQVVPKIVEGKLEAFFKDRALLDQPYIKDDSKTVGDLITEVGARVGEKVEVRRFVRFRLGDED
ncbi:MAG: translation elongation factor Ts [Actinomycetota bacterium]|nr:translation elongation factor Ts [Actinomycetota bacterium]